MPTGPGGRASRVRGEWTLYEGTGFVLSSPRFSNAAEAPLG